MKQYIILISALILVIVCNVFQSRYLQKSSKELLEYINEIKVSLENNNDNDIKFKIQNLENYWKSKKEIWDILTEHDDVEEFESHLASLKVHTSVFEKNESLNEIAFLSQRIKHILENEKVSLGTVF